MREDERMLRDERLIARIKRKAAAARSKRRNIEVLRAEREYLLTENQVLKEDLRFLQGAREKPDSVWVWRDDFEENRLDTLVCPVLIRSEQLRRLLLR